MKSFRVSLLALAGLAAGCTELPINRAMPFPVSFPQSDNFEAGALQDWHQETDAGGWGLEPPPSAMTGAGTRALRLVVTPTSIANHGNRAEVARYQVAQFGDDVYYGWDVFIPAADPDTYGWQILTQFYQLPDFERGETFELWGAHPPVTLVREPGKLVLMTNAPEESRKAETPFTRGVTHRLILHVRWSDGNDGLLEWWMDGVPVLIGGSTTYRGITLHNRAGAYWKLGLYRGAVGQSQAPSTNEIWIDNVKIDRTWAGVQ